MAQGSAPGTVPHWMPVEAVRLHRVMGLGVDLNVVEAAQVGVLLVSLSEFCGITLRALR
ncbi:MAG: hypothetical protein WCF26_12625 [Candidatus Sulfotelmatobacter sp.]